MCIAEGNVDDFTKTPEKRKPGRKGKKLTPKRRRRSPSIEEWPEEPMDPNTEEEEKEKELVQQHGDPGDEDNVECYVPDDEPEFVADEADGIPNSDAEMEDEEDAEENEPPEGSNSMLPGERAAIVRDQEKTAAAKRQAKRAVESQLAALIAEIQDGIRESNCLENNVQVNSLTIF